MGPVTDADFARFLEAIAGFLASTCPVCQGQGKYLAGMKQDGPWWDDCYKCAGLRRAMEKESPEMETHG